MEAAADRDGLARLALDAPVPRLDGSDDRKISSIRCEPFSEVDLAGDSVTAMNCMNDCSRRECITRSLDGTDSGAGNLGRAIFERRRELATRRPQSHDDDRAAGKPKLLPGENVLQGGRLAIERGEKMQGDDRDPTFRKRAMHER